MDQINVCRYTKYEPLIRIYLPIPQNIYNITKKRLQTAGELEQYFPDFILSFIDSIEQQIPRPIDDKRNKTFYSTGNKKKRIKTHLIFNNRGFIIHKLNCKKGRGHDYDIHKENPPIFPKQVVSVVDLGSRHRKGFFTTTVLHTHRKKRNLLQLSQEQKEYNQEHAKKRIII